MVDDPGLRDQEIGTCDPDIGREIARAQYLPRLLHQLFDPLEPAGAAERRMLLVKKIGDLVPGLVHRRRDDVARPLLG